MTIRYKYECEKCTHEYIEQRGNDELNPIFTICNYCNEGTYKEIHKEILSLETERVQREDIINVEDVISTQEIEIPIVEN